MRKQLEGGNPRKRGRTQIQYNVTNTEVWLLCFHNNYRPPICPQFRTLTLYDAAMYCTRFWPCWISLFKLRYLWSFTYFTLSFPRLPVIFNRTGFYFTLSTLPYSTVCAVSGVSNGILQRMSLQFFWALLTFMLRHCQNLAFVLSQH